MMGLDAASIKWGLKVMAGAEAGTVN